MIINGKNMAKKIKGLIKLFIFQPNISNNNDNDIPPFALHFFFYL